MQKRHENEQHDVVFLHRMVRAFYLLPSALSIEDKRDYLTSFTMVSFVRHPFIRLVSTYKDKLIVSGWKHWRSLMNYDDNNPYGVCTLDIIQDFQRGLALRSRFLVIVSLLMYSETLMKNQLFFLWIQNLEFFLSF